MLDNVTKADDAAKAGDKIVMKNIYYVHKKTNSYRRLVYVYQNVTGGYYRAVEISPEYVTIANNKATYSINYFSKSDSADTLEKATKNNWYLSDTYSKYYDATKVM